MSQLYYVQQVGPNLVMLAPIGGMGPDNSLPGGGMPVDPGFGHGGLRPGHLPSYGGGPSAGHLPSHGSGGIPDNSLPSTPPPVVMPGWTLVLVRTASGKWQYATIAPSSPPPRPTPEPIPPGGVPDQGLPPQPGQGLPPTSPGAPDQGLPPTSPGAPDQGLPGSPGSPDQGLPPTAGQLPGAPTPPTAGQLPGAPAAPAPAPHGRR